MTSYPVTVKGSIEVDQEVLAFNRRDDEVPCAVYFNEETNAYELVPLHAREERLHPATRQSESKTVRHPPSVAEHPMVAVQAPLESGDDDDIFNEA